MLLTEIPMLIGFHQPIKLVGGDTATTATPTTKAIIAKSLRIVVTPID